MSPFLMAAGVLTLAAVLALLWPLLRRPRTEAGESAEVAIVRDQLRELERDRERGLISAEEATAARLEVERRLLRAAATTSATGATGRRGTRFAVILAALLAPALSVALYARLGHPALPDQPLLARAQPAPADGQPDIAGMVQRLEERLASAPDDARGWMLLGRSKAALGDPSAAVAAFRQALRLAPNEPGLPIDLAEQLISEAGGIVPPEARTLMERATAASGDPRPGFYLGLAAAQRGETDAAASHWRTLLAEAPADAPWRAEVVAAIRNAQQQLGLPPMDLPAGDAPTATAGGPASPADVEAMSPQDRDAFIRSMVDRLEARLAADGNDAEGWQRLAQSHLVLNDLEAARHAYERGLERFPEDGRLLKGYAALHLTAGPSPEALPNVPEEAARLYERADKASPNDPEVQWYLGIHALQVGRKDEARERWQKVLAGLQPTDPDYAVVKRQIDSLGS